MTTSESHDYAKQIRLIYEKSSLSGLIELKDILKNYSTIEELLHEKINNDEFMLKFLVSMKNEIHPTNKKLISIGKKGGKCYFLLEGKIAKIALLKKTTYTTQEEYYEYLYFLLSRGQVFLAKKVIEANRKSYTIEFEKIIEQYLKKFSEENSDFLKSIISNNSLLVRLNPYLSNKFENDLDTLCDNKENVDIDAKKSTIMTEITVENANQKRRGNLSDENDIPDKKNDNFLVKKKTIKISNLQLNKNQELNNSNNKTSIIGSIKKKPNPIVKFVRRPSKKKISYVNFLGNLNLDSLKNEIIKEKSQKASRVIFINKLPLAENKESTTQDVLETKTINLKSKRSTIFSSDDLRESALRGESIGSSNLKDLNTDTNQTDLEIKKFVRLSLINPSTDLLELKLPNQSDSDSDVEKNSINDTLIKDKNLKEMFKPNNARRIHSMKLNINVEEILNKLSNKQNKKLKLKIEKKSDPYFSPIREKKESISKSKDKGNTKNKNTEKLSSFKSNKDDKLETITFTPKDTSQLLSKPSTENKKGLDSFKNKASQNSISISKNSFKVKRKINNESIDFIPKSSNLMLNQKSESLNNLFTLLFTNMTMKKEEFDEISYEDYLGITNFNFRYGNKVANHDSLKRIDYFEHCLVDIIEKDYFFGDEYLEYPDYFHNITYICLKESIFLSINKSNYERYLRLLRLRLKERKIQYFQDHFLFRGISLLGFFTKFFVYFKSRVIHRREVLIKSGQKYSEIFFLTQGSYEVSINSSLHTICLMIEKLTKGKARILESLSEHIGSPFFNKVTTKKFFVSKF